MYVVEMIQETLRWNLRRLRGERGITQDDLAELTGFSDGYIRQLETGRTWVSIETIGKLAHALGCLQEDLFKAKEPTTTPEEAIKVLTDFVESRKHSRVQSEVATLNRVNAPSEILATLGKVNWDPTTTKRVHAAIKGTIKSLVGQSQKEKKKSTA